MDIQTASPAVLDAVSASTRRVALAVLADQGGTMSVDALAAAVARRVPGRATNGHADAAADELRAELFHVHLPLLAQTGAATFDPDTGLVAAAGASPFDCAWVERLVADHAGPAYDPVLAALASERRQAVLYELLTGGPTDRAGLAVAVAAHERESAAGDVPSSVSQVVELSLRHTHLPALVDAGFLATDPTTERVRAAAMPWRADPWVAASPIGAWAATE